MGVSWMICLALGEETGQMKWVTQEVPPRHVAVLMWMEVSSV